MKVSKSSVLFACFTMSMVSLGTLLFELPAERRKPVRELEKVSLKIIKLKCSLLFNSTCLKEDILPNYSNIYKYTQITMAHAPVGITVLIRFLRRDFDQKIGTLRTE